MLKHCREFLDINAFYEFIDGYTYDYDSGEYIYSEEFNDFQPMFIYLTDEDDSKYLGLLQTLTMYSDTTPSSYGIVTQDGVLDGGYLIENTNTYKFGYFHNGSHINFVFKQEWTVLFGEEDPEVKNITVTLNGVDVTNDVVTIILRQRYTPQIQDPRVHYRNVYTVDIPFCSGDVVITFGDVDSTESNEDDNNENNTGQSQQINTGTDPTLEPITKPSLKP